MLSKFSLTLSNAMSDFGGCEMNGVPVDSYTKLVETRR